MRRLVLVTILMLLLLLQIGCSANDPIVDNLYSEASYIRLASDGAGGYWHEYNMPANELSPGGSGATLIEPNASSLGGYRLDAIDETLYFTSHIEDDWDGVSDGRFDIYFEVNVDNTGGLVTDTVDIQLEVWHKQTGELVNTVFSLDGSIVVGQSDQHELFEMTIPVGDLRTMEVISFRINLNTVFSEVDNIIVNYIEFKYPMYVPTPERG